MGIDAAGAYFMTLKNGAPWITKLFSGFSWMLTLPNDSPIITADGTTGAVTVATSLEATGGGTIEANRTSCTGTDILKADGTCMSNVVRVLDKNATNVGVANTTATTALYSVTVPANTLGTTGCVRLSLDWEGLNNSGTTESFTIRARYGGTASSSAGISFSSSATVRMAGTTAKVCGDGTTGTQRLRADTTISGNAMVSIGEASINSTASQTFEVIVTLSIANANLTATAFHGVSEIVP